MMIGIKKIAQSTAEYAIAVSCIIAAFVGMQVYFARGMEGGYKQNTDRIGGQFSPGYSNYTRVGQQGNGLGQGYRIKTSTNSSDGYSSVLESNQVSYIRGEDDFSGEPLAGDKPFGKVKK